MPIDEGILARWRLRGGVSFVFAPHYSGSDVTGWHRTAENPAFKHITLATAMAISGAAVNPGAADSGVGPQRNKVFGRLMKLLNIRLGYWLPNPRRAAHSRHAPVPNHFSPGLFSNSCGTGGSGRFLELTDGGHFENLGVYELLRREVCTIVACDATADPNLAFSDLQNLISRAEADFGVIFRFQTKPLLGPLMPTQRSGYFPADIPFAKTPFAVADIIYKSGATGTLYYIKPAIFDTLQLDILGFKGTFPAFPHDTTLNQFFDEARFEAYRKLGFACVERMLTVPQIRTTLSII
ncbi:hypothetical protein Abac_006_100 [Acetobacter aceti NBRC 14818]|nr:hypothetical protein Abac_006_100 [Acetobacter aceti NBRC 14818]